MKLSQLQLDEEFILEMAMRVKPANSGLRPIIWVSTAVHAKGRHGPRVKVSNVIGTYSDEDNFSVTISNDPRIIAGTSKFNRDETDDILDWVKINISPLLKYWKDEYEDDAMFYHELKKLSDG